MAQGARKSRQRDYIFEILQRTDGHPTAKWVFDRVRVRFPSLSLGTVYRNLGILVKQGRASRLDFGNGVDRFDARIAPHHHFICERCGAVADLELPVDPALTRRLREKTGLDARRHEIRLYGLCGKCRPKN